MFAKHVTAAVLMVLGLTAHATAEEALRWHNDLEQAKQIAAESNRLVLVHFWADWCKPCMRLETEVFSKPGVAQAIEAHYVPVKLNADHFKATAVGFGINSLPTDVVLDSQGQMVDRFNSPMTAAKYIAQITEVAQRQRDLQAGQAAEEAQANQPMLPAGTVMNPHAQRANPSQQPRAAQPAGQQMPGHGADRYGMQGHQPDPRYGSSEAHTGHTPQAYQPRPQAPYMEQGEGPNAPYVAPANWQNQMPAMGSGYPDDVTQPRPNQPAYGNNQPAMDDRYAPPQHQGQAPVPNSRYVGPMGQQPPQGAPRQPQANMPMYNQQPPVYGQQPPQLGGPGPAQAPAGAQPHVPAPAAKPAGPAPLGLDGYCPVTLVAEKRWAPGDRRWGAIHLGQTYLFTGEAEQQKFLQNPDAYAPVLNGDDPVAAIDGQQSVAGRRNHGLYFRNQVYLFSDEASLARFSQNPQRYVEGVRQAMQVQMQMSAGQSVRR